MPPGSTGMVVAPTYTMLRDATMRTLIDLCRAGGIIKNFNKTELVLELTDGKTILFRSADNPERLRGPNLGWIYLDEAALMPRLVWLIAIGRLREFPGRLWSTTTPRGLKHWIREVFFRTNTKASYEVIHSTTYQNQFLGSEFIESLEEAYPASWRAQELEGKFVDTGSTLFNRENFNVAERAPAGLPWVRYWDLALSVKRRADYTASAAVALGKDGILYIRDMIHGRYEWPDTEKVMAQAMLAEPTVIHGIEQAFHGLAAVQSFRRNPEVAGITVLGIPVDGDKIQRALPWAARSEAGKVSLISGPWVSPFLSEVSAFPDGEHDDQVDTVSGGVQMLSMPHTNIVDFYKRLAQRATEQAEAA